jgi:hypothetical protein
MCISIKSIVAGGCVIAVIATTSACSPRRIPPMTVTDLMEDRVMLDGVLMKCNQNKTKARTDADCLNARIAIERLASKTEPADQAKRAEAFERTREQLRLSQDKQDKLRQEQEAKTKVDVYHMPLVPVEPAPASTPPAQPQSSSIAPPAPLADSPAVMSRSNP